jgi:hypothetical protein
VPVCKQVHYALGFRRRCHPAAAPAGSGLSRFNRHGKLQLPSHETNCSSVRGILRRVAAAMLVIELRAVLRGKLRVLSSRLCAAETGRSLYVPKHSTHRLKES